MPSRVMCTPSSSSEPCAGKLAQTLLEVERRKKTLKSRSEPKVLLAEAQRLLEEFGIEAGNDDHSAERAP
jgi:hypothetical protein